MACRFIFGSYSDDPLDPEWQQAWTVTEKVMARMRDTVEADGARFVVVPWSNFSDIDPDWPATINQAIRIASEGISASQAGPEAARARGPAKNYDGVLDALYAGISRPASIAVAVFFVNLRSSFQRTGTPGCGRRDD